VPGDMPESRHIAEGGDHGLLGSERLAGAHGHTNRSRGKEYRPVANFLLSKRIDLDRRTKSEGYVSKSPISCKLPVGRPRRLRNFHGCRCCSADISFGFLCRDYTSTKFMHERKCDLCNTRVYGFLNRGAEFQPATRGAMPACPFEGSQ
jgi:hypothetical protein